VGDISISVTSNQWRFLFVNTQLTSGSMQDGDFGLNGRPLASQEGLPCPFVPECKVTGRCAVQMRVARSRSFKNVRLPEDAPCKCVWQGVCHCFVAMHCLLTACFQAFALCTGL
jgi:hypothetical protein